MTNKTPMPDTDTLDTLLAAWNDGNDAPDALRGQVSMDEAYALQLALLNRHLNAAVAQGGWKLGQTNAALRAQRGETAPAPGFLLRENQVDAGTTLTLDGPDNWFIEPELVFVMGADLQGASVSADEVRAAVSHVAAGFEIVRTWQGWQDRALQRAVNGSTRGFVVGPVTAGCPDLQTLDDLRVLCRANNEVIADVRAGDVNDNPLKSTAWLVRFLSEHDFGLKAGQIILTGSYAGLVPLKPMQDWFAQIGELAPVTLRSER